MIWHEELPEQCPPADAYAPDMFVGYRLIRKITVEESDFTCGDKSRRHPHIDPCILKGLSIFEQADQAANVSKLPANKRKDVIIAKVVLNKEHGLIKRTFESKGHHTWWRSKEYSITLAEIV